MSPTLEVVLWILGVTAVLALGAYVLLRWIAFRIAARIALIAEERLAASLAAGAARAGSGSTAPPVVLNTEQRRRYLAQVEWLAWLMDGMIPLPVIGGIGLDPILGLVPVGGDVASLIISSFVIIRAAQLGAPPEILSRLVAVQCVDLLIGAVPIVGDLADAGYHANERSVAILREWMKTFQ